MKNAVSAVKYGINTLGITPDKMFSLIESSKGYDGDDYQRWLAGKIIETLENKGFGYSQLLVKKFDIIQDIKEDACKDLHLKDAVKSRIVSSLSEKIYSVGISDVGTSLDDIDWFTGIDLDETNSMFTREILPEDMRKDILSNKEVSLLARLSEESVSKKSELFIDAKARGITCSNFGSLLLYRVCSMLEAFDCSNLKLGLVVDTEFLYNKDNSDIIDYFLSYFKYSGFVMKSMGFFEGSLDDGEYAYILCKPRGKDDLIQDGFTFKVNGVNKRYSYSHSPMIDKIKSESVALNDMVVCEENGKPKSILKGYKEALGYLHTKGNVYLTSNPVLDSDNIAITKDNLKDIIVYYSVTKSIECFGLFTGIQEIVDGHKDYKELLSNCIPLFLFDVDSKFCDMGTAKKDDVKYRLDNKFDIKDSEIVKSLLEEAEVYFSYESKNLLDISKGFIDYLEDIEPGSTKRKTFNDIRVESNNADLNKAYLSALVCIKDYITTLYRKMS